MKNHGRGPIVQTGGRTGESRGQQGEKKPLAQNFTSAHLEWVSGDRAGGFQLILQRGEPTRMMSESIRQHINWVLFTMARMEGEARQGIQMP